MELPAIVEAFARKWNIKKETIFYVGDAIVINCTPHELKLDDGRIIPPAPEAQAKLLSASVIEREIEPDEIAYPLLEKLVTIEYKPSKIGNEFTIDALNNGIWLVGSIISANAFSGRTVVSPIVTPETSRKPPTERIVFSNKWNYVP